MVQHALRRRYGKQGIYAGATHFADYWSRDALFACLGSLALKDYDQVRATLEHFLAHLDKDGHVPLRIGAKSEVRRYLRLPAGHGAVHSQDKGNNESVDGNSLLLIVAQHYEQACGKRLDRIKLAQVQQWLDKNDHEGLIAQGPYADWEDSIKHQGVRLYTNLCYYRGLIAAAYLFSDERFVARALNTKRAIQLWWNGTHFRDGPQRKTLMTAGNLLAVTWGLASLQQSRAILERIARRNTVCPPAGWWKPGARDVYVPFFLINLRDYHGMLEWSWLAALEIGAYRIIGEESEALKRESALQQLIDLHGTLYEVYEHDKPVRRLVYRSEREFAWALGILIAAKGEKARYLR